MHSKTRRGIFYILLCVLLSSCGEGDHSPEIILSGTIRGEHAAAQSDKPILVAVLPYNKTSPLNLGSLKDMKALVAVDKRDLSFEIDLTDAEVSPGDRISLFAFVDLNAGGRFPVPEPGDYLGVYLDAGTYSTAYTLTAGVNSGIQIPINRTIYACAGQISFQISSESTIRPQPGEAIIVTAVEAQGVDLTTRTIDMNYVVAKARLLTKTDGQPYLLDLFPAVFDGIAVTTDPFGINALYLFAVIDGNGNGKPDAGEYLGVSSSRVASTQTYLPQAFAVGNGLNTLNYPVIFTGEMF